MWRNSCVGHQLGGVAAGVWQQWRNGSVAALVAIEMRGGVIRQYNGGVKETRLNKRMAGKRGGSVNWRQRENGLAASLKPAAQ
jgi:hypothetical protein